MTHKILYMRLFYTLARLLILSSAQRNCVWLEFDIDVLEDLRGCDTLGAVRGLDQIVARPALLLATPGIGYGA